MKIKIIDLLNKMASGEEVPTKIKYNYITWEWNEKQKDYIELNGATRNLFTYYLDNLTECLNNGIEIIEEPVELPNEYKIPKMESADNERILQAEIKINEIISYLKSKEEGKEK